MIIALRSAVISKDMMIGKRLSAQRAASDYCSTKSGKHRARKQTRQDLLKKQLKNSKPQKNRGRGDQSSQYTTDIRFII